LQTLTGFEKTNTF